MGTRKQVKRMPLSADFDAQARAIIEKRRHVFGSRHRMIEEAVTLARSAAEVAGEAQVLDRLERCREADAITTMWMQARDRDRKRTPPKGEPMVERIRNGTVKAPKVGVIRLGNGFVVPERIHEFSAALIDVLPQYGSTSEKEDATRFLETALRQSNGNRNKQKRIVEAAINAWGANGLAYRLKYITERDFDFRLVFPRRRESGLGEDEFEFLTGTLGMKKTQALGLVDVSEDSIRIVSRRLDILVAVSPDKERAKAYAKLVLDRFSCGVEAGSFVTVTEFADARRKQRRTMVEDLSRAMFFLQDLGRRIPDFRVKPDEVTPIPGPNEADLASVVRVKIERELKLDKGKTVEALELDPENGANHGRIREALEAIRSEGMFIEVMLSERLRDMDPEVPIEIRVLELRFLDTDETRSHTRVARMLREEGTARKRLNVDKIKELEVCGLGVLVEYLNSV